MEAAKKYLAGVFFLVFLAFGISLVISMQLFKITGINKIINTSAQPWLTLWLVSMLFASGILALINLGIELPLLGPWIKRPTHPLFSYLLGLPLAVMLVVFTISGVSLALIGNSCESPTAEIRVTTLDGTTVNYSGRSITAVAGSKLTFQAQDKESSALICRWAANGAAVKNISPESDCVTQVTLSNDSTSGLITLALSRNYCSLTTTYSFQIAVAP